MLNYQKLVSHVLEYGALRKNRTGIDTISVFGASLVHDMRAGLPILTTKKIYIKGCIYELLWFLKGDTNIKYLTDNNVHIWDEWADKDGNLGPIYGKQWINSGEKHINQIQYIINEIKHNPYSRRIVLDAWGPSDLKDMALPPCHVLYQFYADPASKQLSLNVYMRSGDLFLGVPFDIAEGGLLLNMVATVTGYNPYRLTYYFGDLHIYVNHLNAIKEQLSREPYKLPKLDLPIKESIFDYKYKDFKILNYKCHPTIKGKVAI
jgi:thymidylate synthase